MMARRPSNPAAYVLGALRAALAILVARALFGILIDGWRAGESAIVVGCLRFAGMTGIKRIGAQILMSGPDDRLFVANVGTLCSSLGVTLAFCVFAAAAPRCAARRRLRALGRGLAIVIVCNLVRIASVVTVGKLSGPASIEWFHDGPATAFAVAFVLAAFGAMTFTMWPRARKEGHEPDAEPDVDDLNISGGLPRRVVI